MNESHRTYRFIALTFSVAAALTLSACGGSGTSSNASAVAGGISVGESDAATTSSPASGAVAPGPSAAGSASATGSGSTAGSESAASGSVAVANPSLPVLALPASVSDGGTIQLDCGRVYAGGLKLSGKSNVTIKTTGSCGNATITPGRAITGWSKVQGNIYVAAAPFDVAQLLIDGQPMPLAHWPSRAQTWAKATASGSTSLSYALPNADVVGATLLFRPNDWAIEARKVTGYSGTTMNLATTGNVSFDGYSLGGQPDFYLEGKRWMLDEPGEWVFENGQLYVWMPDGLSPEGRNFASPATDVIDASNSKGISIDGVTLYGGANGVNAMGASDLRLTNVQIVNPSENGILNSGGKGLYVDGATILNARHDAIAIKWGGGGETIQNSVIDASGSVGMPTNVHAAINLVASDGGKVLNNKITRSGFIGIRVFRNAVVSKNTIDTACTVLTDCGGIYVYSEDKTPLNTLIDGNSIANVGGKQKLAWAIDLDNNASAVTVSNNTIANNANGMQLHDAFGNTISGNRFSASFLSHLQMVEDGATAIVRNNVVKGNTFVSINGEETYRISSTLGAASVAQFASYADNSYTSSSATFANHNGEALNFAQWKARTGQDASSTFVAP